MLGALSIRRSVPAPLYNIHDRLALQVEDQPFLSRYQTDEWKGWMQSIILIYHYTGASRVLWIYEVVRLLVASYIFMTGFGHTVFFYKRSDYSLRRSAAVLIRLNLLSCLLPYVMNTDYLFYYFAPLISFWYLVVYLTMAVGRSRNSSFGFLAAKIMISAILTTAIIRIPGIFEIVFQVLATCFNIRWNVEEWRFRLRLDSLVVYAGMFCGVFFVRKDELNVGNAECCAVNRLIRQFFWVFRIAWLAMAAFTPPVFYLFVHRAPDKYAYNAWVPYISIAAVLAYISIRNINRHTRNFHSSIFSWMGRHSLETFTLQFHIWLAGDTKGLLALGVFEGIKGSENWGRRVDLALLTIIFLWVSWHVAAATQTLTIWIIDPSEGVEDVGLNEVVTGVEGGSPRVTNDKDFKVFNASRAADGIVDGMIKSAARLNKHVVVGLTSRIGVILGMMWLLNMVSTQAMENPPKSFASL